jgi:predicted hydrocarbon binding protein
MSRSVNARIPLSLLESIRRIDTPDDHTDTEYVPELRNKRLGLSDTVYTQIRRYSDAMKRGQKIPFAEAEGLGTLIGRRPDANELFKSAGSILANDIYESLPAPARTSMRVLPKLVSRPMALKQLATIAQKYFGGTLEKNGSLISLRIPESVTVNGSPNSAGCAFYEEAFRELLRLLTGNSSQVDHVQCSGNSDGCCEWRAEWVTN